MVNTPKKYFQTEQIVLENTSAIPIGPQFLFNQRIDIPQDYNFLLGMLIIPIDTTIDPNFRVGLRTKNKEIIEITHNSLFAASTSIAPKEKFLPVNEIINKDNFLEILMNRGTTYAPGDKITFDVVLVLTDLEEWSKYQELKGSM